MANHQTSHSRQHVPASRGIEGGGAAAAAAPGGGGLRSRKLSLTTRHLPSSTTSQVSPSPSSASPQDSIAGVAGENSLSEIGLGLMLDEAAAGSSSEGRASVSAARRIDETDQFFLAATQNNNHDESDMSSSALASRRNSANRLPQLSTVTTGKTTSSPLQIFTGSPQPSPLISSTSPLPTAVPLPRPYSPHQAYNLHSTTSAPLPPPSSSASASMTSFPMSRPPSYNTIMAGSSSSASQPMDRSRSNGSDIHSRQQSLTSACPPATSSINGFNTPKSDVTAFSPVSSHNGGRSWRTYDWGVPSEKGGLDEDVREGAKSRGEEVGIGSKILAIPNALLAIFLAPLTGTNPTSSNRQAYSPNLSGPSSSSKPTLAGPPASKRYPLIVRLFTIAYLIFSFLFLTLNLSSRLLSSSSSNSLKAKLESRGGQEGWQLMRQYADGLGAKAGIDLSWAHYKSSVDEVAEDSETGEEWGTIRRIGHPDKPVTDSTALDAQQNPLTPLTHTYRFSKMHEKIHWDLHDEIVPFAFRASSKPFSDDVTACLYSNPAWLSTLPSFLRTWRGPVSLIFESPHSRTDTSARSALLADIQALRDSDTLVKTFVDFHIIGTPRSTSERTLNKTRERMIKNPSALNYQLNLARFFARTDVVFLAGDARLTPSGGLRRRLASPGIRKLVLDRGDAVVVPSFGFIRDPTADPESNPVPSIDQLRSKLEPENAPSIDPFSGVGPDEFESLANEYVRTMIETLPLKPEEWPSRKQQLVQLVNTRIPSPDTPTTASLALYDRRWDINHGPTNWYLWRKSSVDPRLGDEPTAGGGLGLGLDGTVGGGREVYKVVDYDLHYAPHVVVSKKGQPWCTERFDGVRAACVYQMYLMGAELWVLPDEWVYTLESLEKRPEGDKEDPADKLRNSISSRLFGKFHQEACMHYGREFLSVAMWDSEKAQHLRETCARTLSSWGMGSS
ncbi:uncharacterized protein JCM6883_006132 [Sporobolomyces salmoneus]|uniref:uncharacterized protein n=1 Tax=Sporobolomyces salmoneus TaxID=183962 RepID=UPI00316F98BF